LDLESNKMIDGLSEAEMIQMAIDASIASSANTTDLVLSSVEVEARERIQRGDKHAPSSPVQGTIIQINTINQFHGAFGDSIREFQAASSICGYMVMAHALLISRHMPATGLANNDDVEALVCVLKNMEVVLPEVRKAMEFVQNSRASYIMNHAAEFSSDRQKKSYMQNWVANYEISDFLRHCHETEGESAVAEHIHFLRFNQWPEYGAASHEEKLRLEEEEARFGGSPGEKGSTTYREEDSVFIFEKFAPERLLLSAQEYAVRCREQSSSDQHSTKAFILDLNGHFAVAVRCNLSLGDEPTMLVFNTTSTTYFTGSAGLMIAAGFDSCFPSSAT